MLIKSPPSVFPPVILMQGTIGFCEFTDVRFPSVTPAIAAEKNPLVPTRSSVCPFLAAADKVVLTPAPFINKIRVSVAVTFEKRPVVVPKITAFVTLDPDISQVP